MTFGTWLARERELRGITLAEVAESTKIPRTTIEAIEADDAHHRPGRTYLLGSLRAIAEVLGLDPDDVVLRYEEAEGAEERGAETGARGRTAPSWARVIVLAMVGVLLAGGAVLTWLLVG